MTRDVSPTQLRVADALAALPLAPTPSWPAGVWDVEMWAGSDVSVSLFAPRGDDYQSPHDRDELYLIVSGRGMFSSTDGVVPYAPGDVLYVPAGVRHRFESPIDGLVAWVMFWGGTDQRRNAQKVRAMADAWLREDLDAAMRDVADDCTYSTAVGTEWVGEAAVRAGFAAAIPTTPGTRLVLGDPIACGDRVFLEWQVLADPGGASVGRGDDLFTMRDGRVVRKDVHRKVPG